jgi:protein-disulfide isomerase
MVVTICSNLRCYLYIFWEHILHKPSKNKNIPSSTTFIKQKWGFLPIGKITMTTHTSKKKTSEHKSEKKPTSHNKAQPTPWYNVVGTWQIISLILLLIIIVMALNNPGTGSGTTTNPVANTDGKIIIEEYSDFGCPFCSRVVPTINELKEKYGDNIEVQFKQFPIVQLHPNAPKAAEASECARDQEKFWEYHDVLFENQQAQDVASLKKYASDLGLDTATFNSCLDNGDKTAKVNADLAEGRAKGITGTPTFFVNGNKLVGAQPIAAFEALIGQAPAAAPSVPAAPAAAPAIVDIAVASDDRVKGDVDAPVTIFEWSDFECPFCTRFFTDSLSQIDSEYVETGKVKVVFKHFPLSFHANARPAALASECAGDQGKFWEYHDVLFESGSLSASALEQHAVDLGLDATQFNACLSSEKYADKVDADTQQGANAGIRGTPGFIINGQAVSGAQPFSVFQQVIEAELAK